jgi:hypothetical protein
LRCPKQHVEKLTNVLDEIHKKGILKDLEENGKEKLYIENLATMNVFYVGDYTDAIEKVEDYPITPEEIIKVYNTKKREHLE